MTYQPTEIAAPTSETYTAAPRSESLYGGWPDRSAIRFFIAQQLETAVAWKFHMPLPNRGDDPSITDSNLDRAWPELDRTLTEAMANWEHPDDLLEMLEQEASHCANHVLAQASESQRRELEAAAARALAQQSSQSSVETSLTSRTAAGD